MDDHAIIQLYWDRDPQAIPATDRQYGPYCTAIARNILQSPEDAEECVNDTYLRTWNAIPPQRPRILPAFLAKITRNLAFNRFRAQTAQKRGGGTLPLVLDELRDCAASGTEEAVDQRELIRALEDFLSALPAQKRRIFLRRYWYTDSIDDIARQYGLSQGAVTMQLHRMRESLRRHLSERGFDR